MRYNKLVIDKPFEFEGGGRIDHLDLVYYTSDREYRPGDVVVWICHALTGNANPEDWWPQLVGPGKLFDPDKFFIVCVSMLCSPYGETGPASVNPAAGRPYFFDFPRTTVRDIVAAEILVRKHLGIGRIDLMLGPSIGGFQALEWVIMEPEVVREVVFLATATRVTPFMTAFNESQRLALKADPTFLAAESLEGGRAGLVCARSIALISYRTFAGYNYTQAEPEEDTLFADRAASYQRYQGEKLVRRSFDAYSYWYLTYALDSMNVGRGRGGVEAALARIQASCMMISIDSDVLFPPSHGRSTVAALKYAAYREITSPFGHDGFLIENDQLTAILQPLLERLTVSKDKSL
ncbi:MAG: homoserine O-acetyltransferase [Bacteroidales bacterium]|nr:homoserine O-acetyltransferase [Bacteroidales bacterium]